MSKKLILAFAAKGVVLAVIVAGLFVLYGCGKKSPLEPPPGYQKPQAESSAIPAGMKKSGTGTPQY
tara:strand:+ start:10109 stop:10306 length:198 start_codon:yes stop_codon:yes gene_type:complete